MSTLDPISALVIAVRARLKTVLGKAWSVHVVPPQLSEQEFLRLLEATPMAAIAVSTVETGNGARLAQGVCSFSVMIVIKNPSARDARFLGDAAGAGLYPAVSLVSLALAGLTIPEVGSVTVAEIRPGFSNAFADQNLVAGSVECRATLAFRRPADPDLPDFSGFSDWETNPSNPEPAP